MEFLRWPDDFAQERRVGTEHEALIWWIMRYDFGYL